MKKSMARIVARDRGEATYVPEAPCARGHLLRSTSGGSCIECRRSAEKARYYKYPEKAQARTKKKYHAHAEVLRAKRRDAYTKNREVEKAIAKVRSSEWRLKNPEHAGAKAAKAKYKAENPAKTSAATAKRRTAKMHRTPAWLPSDDLWLIEQAYELAALRTKMFGFSWHVDHVIPLQGKTVSGLHVPTNLQVIPWLDNVKKANKVLSA